MFTTIRRQPRPKAYTIIESLVVLVILTIVTMLVAALVIYEKEPAQPKGKTSASIDSAPTEPLPPAISKDKPE
jgi:competence protein ComGC